MTEPGLLSCLLFFEIFHAMKNNNRFSKTELSSDKLSLVRKKNRIVPAVLIVFLAFSALVFSFFFAVRIIKNRLSSSATTKALSEKWKEYDYEEVYGISRQILEEKPFSNTALTYHGYSSFYLAVAQTDTSLSQNYLDESINSIRLALYSAKKNLAPQLEYMLGKAYFYKNTVTSYYYADLAVKYLTSAKEKGYDAKDIPEYLGLSYAALGKPMESIESFTEALLFRESDSLLLSIAEQYYKVGQLSAAKQYLYRIKKESDDVSLVLKSMELLGTIYIDEKNYADAQTEFEGILEKNKNSAAAFYGLGLVYEKQGNLVKARSEWRKALRIQINHPGALSKLSDYGK